MAVKRVFVSRSGQGCHRHGFDGGVEVALPVSDRAADADEWDDAGHAPGIELTLADAEVLAGFLVGEERAATVNGACLCVHMPPVPVSTCELRQPEEASGVRAGRMFGAQRTAAIRRQNGYR